MLNAETKQTVRVLKFTIRVRIMVMMFDATFTLYCDCQFYW